ncbi:MAG: hypothetical protein J6Y02_01160 [Pseudobutyrivibrio sp.]|nr:hypothetical protein [Pseudobutyrivibrio sp.]
MKELINLFVVVKNSVLVRALWLIIGAVIGIFGWIGMTAWLDINAVEDDKEPKFYRDEVLFGTPKKKKK